MTTMMEPAKPPPPHISPPGMYYTKLVLRTLQFAIAIANVGLVGSLLSTGFWGFATLVVITPQSVVSAIWSLSEIICILARGGHRGIHPGACVAVDLLLWLALAPGTAALFIWGIATAIVADATGYSDGSGRSSSYSGDVSDTLQRVQVRGQALVGLAAVLTILHFVTFVIACVETSIRNRRPQQVVFVQAGHQQHSYHLQSGTTDGQPLVYHHSPGPQPQQQRDQTQAAPMYTPRPQEQGQVYYHPDQGMKA